ncbi:hypothetical protein RJT34_26430 [Clitoria ternatea]|uniref:Glycosyltransferase n=1 Tax=Clitoria ternatea TaxID=43366 RepID=A0AAN9FBU7_CLITE
MKDTIVLYPNIGRGHLISMVELGKLIQTHHPSFSITILILTPPTPINTILSCDSTTQYINTISSTTPSITFHHIPPTPLPSTPSFPPHLLSFEISLYSTQNVAVSLQSLAKSSNLKALIMDFLNFSDPQTITRNLNIPTYFYYTSGASTLSILLKFPTLYKAVGKSFQDLHLDLHYPGLPVFNTDDFPNEANDPENNSFPVLLKIAETMNAGVGIIVNTFEAIEERAIKALNEEETTPPLYCIGPVIAAPYGEEDKGCLTWLDSQPSQSVVLLCFGSLGRFSKAQVKEIAIGLEKSEQRFLWVLRTELDPVDSEEKPGLDELLPEGFLERTKEKGLVVSEWAPQAKILSHDSVGGFVTHCGWNSVLEAICEGVPMVAWPLYAEQRMNRVIMVREMKVALELKEGKDGFVSGTELEERVRELMESGTGKEIRQRIFKMKICAAEAMAEGGSSCLAIDKLALLFCGNKVTQESEA